MYTVLIGPKNGPKNERRTDDNLKIAHITQRSRLLENPQKLYTENRIINPNPEPKQQAVRSLRTFLSTLFHGNRKPRLQHIMIYLLTMLLSLPFSAAMLEDERMDNYHKRGYQWPLKEVVPNTEGWRNIFNRRTEQIQRMPSSGSSGKYDAWLQTMSSAVVAPNFTENG